MVPPQGRIDVRTKAHYSNLQTLAWGKNESFSKAVFPWLYLFKNCCLPTLSQCLPKNAGVPRQCPVRPVLPSGAKHLLIVPSLGIRAVTALLGLARVCSPWCWRLDLKIRTWVLSADTAESSAVRGPCRSLGIFPYGYRTAGPQQWLSDPGQSLSLTFLVFPPKPAVLPGTLPS